jgi:hypothetical protein
LYVPELAIVNRVHWIRARGQKNRWHEELILTAYEMTWTVRYFLNQFNLWMARKKDAQASDLDGAAAYACRKMAMWTMMARQAEVKFGLINSGYYSIVDEVLRAGSRG